MNKARKILACIIFSAMVLSSAMVEAQQDDSENISKEYLQNMYLEYLNSEGFKPELDNDGDIIFKREGRTYIVFVQKSDPGFFHLVLPNIYKIDSPSERLKAMAAANRINYQSKVVKAYAVRDRINLSTEVFFNNPEDFVTVFNRLLSTIENGLRIFTMSLHEYSSQQRENQPVETTTSQL